MKRTKMSPVFIKSRDLFRIFELTNHKKIFNRCLSNCSSAGHSSKFVTLENMNQNIRRMEYAVRGPLLLRASEIEKELEAGVKKPFKNVIKANLGDCHAMGQKPITFFRQVLSLVCYPELLKSEKFPPDAVARAKELLKNCRGQSVGSYTESNGLDIVRKHVAESIEKRDGYPSDWNDILISNGASESIKNVLKLINQDVNGKKPAVMVPVPQYPLYSASLAELDFGMVRYYLKENKNWGLDLEELNRSYKLFENEYYIRAIVVINPGNPTGQVLTKNNIKEIAQFAKEKRLVILADEVYQNNIYAEGSEFFSFKKILKEMGEPYSNMELASFMSCSKGYMGECGIRGGYCELSNFDPDVKANFGKRISASLCSTVLGQCLLDCVVKPPQKGDPSYDLFIQEKSEILKNLKEKAIMVYKAFNNIKGYSCNEVQGAMYAFPKLEIPQKAIDEAKSKKLAPDTMYAFELLENTGICIIPGSGFKQEPGTYHFRTTILPPIDQLEIMIEKFKEFHLQFLDKYS